MKFGCIINFQIDLGSLIFIWIFLILIIIFFLLFRLCFFYCNFWLFFLQRRLLLFFIFSIYFLILSYINLHILFNYIIFLLFFWQLRYFSCFWVFFISCLQVFIEFIPMILNNIIFSSNFDFRFVRIILTSKILFRNIKFLFWISSRTLQCFSFSFKLFGALISWIHFIYIQISN